MSRPPSLGRAYAVYFAIRLAVFGVVLALLLGLGLRGLVALLVALVVSGLLSYPLARAQRRRVIDAVEARARRRRQGGG